MIPTRRRGEFKEYMFHLPVGVDNPVAIWLGANSQEEARMVAEIACDFMAERKARGDEMIFNNPVSAVGGLQ